MNSRSRMLLDFYLTAKEQVIVAGFAREIDAVDWARVDLTEEVFLGESAWVVLCSGFRASVVRDRFSGVSSAFLGWSSATEISTRRDECIRDGLRHFNSTRKLSAIADIAAVAAVTGVERIRALNGEELVAFCAGLPFVGPITAYHLAKNLGADVAKPDRHLTRLAKDLGFQQVSEMCAGLAALSNDRVSIVDSVLWRSAVIRQSSHAADQNTRVGDSRMIRLTAMPRSRSSSLRMLKGRRECRCAGTE
jgi:hypothetical protein